MDKPGMPSVVNDAILSHLRKNRSILLKCMKFDPIFIANEMNSEGLLSDPDHVDITDVKSMLSSENKASKIVLSLEDKVDINSQHLETFVRILKKKRRHYSDAIEILEAPLMTDSDPSTDTTRSPNFENVVAVSSEKKEAPTQSIANDSLMNATHPLHSGNAAAVSSEAAPIQSPETPPPKRIKLDDSSSISMAPVSKKFELHLESSHEIRHYQEELAEPGLNGENYILVAPTGTGKTLVAAKIIADHLKKNDGNPNSHVTFVVRTKPLADQQRDALSKYIPDASVDVCTSETELSVALSCKLNHVSVCTGGKLEAEICRKELKFSQLSLIIFDECHSAVGGNEYANIMKYYIEEVLQGSIDKKKQIQIIGMTASPGAGKNPRLEVRKTIEHLKLLIAHLNSTSGIKTVVKNTDELDYYRNAPKLKRLTLTPRNPNGDPFIDQILASMKEIEKDLEEFNFEGLKKWGLEYERTVRQGIFALELSDNKAFRDPIRAYTELLGYCTALSVYMNLNHADSIKILKEFVDVLKDDTIATPAEKKYKAIRYNLIERLESLTPTKNPFLEKIEDILYGKFKKKEDSRGLIFVRTRMEAKAMSEWISNSQKLTEVGVRPGMIVGHASKKNDSMTQAEQKIIIEKFRDGTINLLLATSVAEEGLDIPACNLVMSYQYVVTDIKKEQAKGRARATDSECYTIVSSDSYQKYKDMRNEDAILLVRDILKSDALPSGNDLHTEIKKLQRKIIDDKRKKELILKQKRVYKGNDIQLLCKNCKIVACSGSDVRITGDEPYLHYVVQAPEFKDKYKIKPHHTPGALTDRIYKTHKIYCKECGTDWGVKCVWSDKRQYPIIKCQYFTFKIGDDFVKVKKWSHAPFEIEPMDKNMDYELGYENDV